MQHWFWVVSSFHLVVDLGILRNIFSDLIMEVIGANLDRIKTPGPNDKVYKDECFYSFDSPVRHFKLRFTSKTF